jgi:hypothetical protein
MNDKQQQQFIDSTAKLVNTLLGITNPNGNGYTYNGNLKGLHHKLGQVGKYFTITNADARDQKKAGKVQLLVRNIKNVTISRGTTKKIEGNLKEFCKNSLVSQYCSECKRNTICVLESIREKIWGMHLKILSERNVQLHDKWNRLDGEKSLAESRLRKNQDYRPGGATQSDSDLETDSGDESE